MNDNNTVALAAIGVLGTAVVALAAVANYALKRLGGDLREHTKAAIQQTASNEKVGEFISSSEQYLRDRNGRDAEIHKEMMVQIQATTDAVKEVPKMLDKVAKTSVKTIIRSFGDIPEQHVEHQHVEIAELKKVKEKE